MLKNSKCIGQGLLYILDTCTNKVMEIIWVCDFSDIYVMRTNRRQLAGSDLINQINHTPATCGGVQANWPSHLFLGELVFDRFG